MQNDIYNVVEIDGKRYKKSRLTMEFFLGRTLSPFEIVHHINGNKKDDYIFNLELKTTEEHATHHHAGNKHKYTEKIHKKKNR